MLISYVSFLFNILSLSWLLYQSKRQEIDDSLYFIIHSFLYKYGVFFFWVSLSMLTVFLMSTFYHVYNMPKIIETIITVMT